MKITYKLGLCNVEVESDTASELFKQISQFTSLPHKCGHCDSTNIIPHHRTAGANNEYSYLQMRCIDCEAGIDIGQSKTGGEIYADKRKQEYKNVKDGWYKYKEQDYYSGNDEQSHKYDNSNDPF